MASIDLGDTFNSLFNLAPGPGSADGIRAVMSFTSTLRRRVLLNAAEEVTRLSESQLTVGSGTSTALQRENARIEGQILDIDGRMTLAMPIITMALNPKSVRFVQPKRFTRKDTQTGTTFFHFANSKGENNDILTMTFQGSTGNIDLQGTFSQPERDPGALQSGTAIDRQAQIDQDTGALRKLIVWHNLYQLSREPMLLPDNTENEFRITYMSQLFTTDITFVGFFSKVLEFEENATKPNSRDYSFEFIVTRTEPELDQLVSHIFSSIQKAQNLSPSDTSSLLSPNLPLTTP